MLHLTLGTTVFLYCEWCLVILFSTERKARGNRFAYESEGLQPDTMKSFLLAKTVQTTMSQGGGECDVKPRTLVSLWKQPRFLSVWNSLDVNLSDRQGVDLPDL